jgi:hypothetical protein
LHINQISTREKLEKSHARAALLSRTNYLNTMPFQNSTAEQSPLNFTKRSPPQFKFIPQQLALRVSLDQLDVR